MREGGKVKKRVFEVRRKVENFAWKILSGKGKI
jgi:hypothetical protein